MRNKNLRLYIIVIALFAIILGGFSYYYYGSKLKESQETDPVVAEIQGEKIYLSEYEEVLNESNGGKFDEHIKEPLLQELVELRVLESFFATKSIDVKIAESQYSRLKSLRQKFLSEYTIWKEGYALFCRYDKGFDDDYIEREDEGRQLVSLHKPYAEKYCIEAKSRLEAGSDFADELKKLEDDQTIGAKAWFPDAIIFGTEFNKEFFKKEYFTLTFDIFDKIASTKIPLNTPTIIESQFLRVKENGMYALVNITDENAEGITTDYVKWLEGRKDELNIKLYPENIIL